jgi:hypothetical protein
MMNLFAMSMPARQPPEHEQPLSVLNRDGIDPLLVRLRAVHSEAGRPDIAPELWPAVALPKSKPPPVPSRGFATRLQHAG